MHFDNCHELGTFFMRVNVTSVYQPLDQGTFIVTKTNARAKLLEKIVGNLFHHCELRELGKKQNENGVRDLRYTHPAHHLYETQCFNFALSKLYLMRVSGCWMKAGNFLPSHMQAIYENFMCPISN